MEKSRLISSLHDVLLENIKNAFLAIPKKKEVFRSIIRNLQETLVSMKPLLLVQMDPTMEQRFRYLLETLDSHIPHLARFKEMLPAFDTSYMTRLEDLKEKLRKFYSDYVQDQLIRIYEVEGTYGPAKGGFTNVYWLSGEVLNMIRTEIAEASYSVKPSLKKLKIILVSLLCKEHDDDTSELLCLLKGVRVCVHFLNGHHGIDIQKYLRGYEQELRRFIEEETRMKLENLDWRYEERRRKKHEVIKFFGASVVAYITYAPQTPISSIFFMAAVTVFVSLFKSESSGIYAFGITNVYRLSRKVLNMIRTEMATMILTSNIKKLKIILVSLLCKEHDDDDTSELLCLLKGLRVCVQNYLRNYEQESRRFIEEEAQKELEDLDERYEERRRKKAKKELDMIKFFGASVVAYITYAPQTPISSFFFIGAVTVFVILFKDGYSFIVNLSLTGFIVAPFIFSTEILFYWVFAIGTLVVCLNLSKSEIHERQEEGEDESYVILFLTAIGCTTVACFAYWENTLISCILFIVVIVGLANNFKCKSLVRQRRNFNDELENASMFFTVIFVISAVIFFVSLFKPEIPGKDDINNEIFLSFRGSDTRYIFASFLHNNLEKANIRTFFDERNMRKGKQIWEELQREIRTSVGAIIILSENYAESEDCLDELLQILKRARKYQQYILEPIFYDVKPEDLTDKRSKFYRALQKHRNTKKIKEWAGALETLASFAGYSYTSNWDHMDQLIDKIVGDVKGYLRTANGRQVLIG